MTAGENIMLALKQKFPKRNKKELKEIAINMIKAVGLDEAVYKKLPKELSGGMKQRVAIARAYAVDPSVLLMDEPFGALDAQTRTQLQSELIKTWQEQKKTCFFITHDVEEAVILATKVIIMSARPGRIKKIVDVNLPYPRTQEMKMELPFLDLKTYIWGEVYQEYLEVRK
jgi:NitT/TauT family transport system ATP-binding protein